MALPLFGGNVTASLWERAGAEQDEMGFSTPVWEERASLTGYLDRLQGGAEWTKGSAYLMDSSNVFLCDYAPLSGLCAENCRITIGGRHYAVTMIDDPMGLHDHLEIYLNYAGGEGA